MRTYYTYWNYATYGIAVIAIAGLCLASKEAFDRRSGPLSRAGIGSLIAAAIALPLSATCPYPGWDVALRLGGIVCLLGGLALISSKAALARLRSRRGAARGRGEPRLARWILDSLRDSVIIMDSDYRLLSWGALRFGELGPFRGDSLRVLVARLEEAGYEPELAAVLGRVAAGESPTGELDRGARRFRYWRSEIGTGDVRGYAFCLGDVSGEYAMARSLEAQNTRLLNRYARLIDEAALDRSIELEKRTLAAQREATSRIRSYLRAQSGRLRLLAEGSVPEAAQIQTAIAESREAMERVREAVHSIPYS
ncbi:MAG: hypothetical protein KKA67_10385 [Spirochaetes bacterium]|nr:hypothetical protein [Spirochaetota bacterium]MBU1078887.1 hypothetical protein [Spirochaetota bacterium]